MFVRVVLAICCRLILTRIRPTGTPFCWQGASTAPLTGSVVDADHNALDMTPELSSPAKIRPIQSAVLISNLGIRGCGGLPDRSGHGAQLGGWRLTACVEM